MCKVNMSKELAELLIDDYLFNLDGMVIDMPDEAFEELKELFNELKDVVEKYNLEVDTYLLENCECNFEDDEDDEE